MAQKVKLAELRNFLSHNKEDAYEDGAISFFRSYYGEKFLRKSEAHDADGFVQGLMICELKGSSDDWYKGLCQSLVYLKKLDAPCVVVACNNFMGLWLVDDLPDDIVQAARSSKKAPSAAGPVLARTFNKIKGQILKKALWLLPSESISSSSVFQSEIENFLAILSEFSDAGKKRKTISRRNFLAVLTQFKDFFDEPLDSIKAFYDLLTIWHPGCTFHEHPRNPSVAVLRKDDFAVEISNIIPNKKKSLSDFISNHRISDDQDELRSFFEVYDQALDAVAPGYRRTNGIFFTDVNLARFALWFAREHLGKNFGDKYLVLDPACGSGNLVSSWRSPLMMRHKVVSDIDPLHLHIVHKRLSLDPDPKQRGNFTVVPNPNGGFLNFIDKSADDYLKELKRHLKESGQKADRPLAILCNPPYRNDDDQTSGGSDYKVHPSLIELCGGADSSSDRLSMFLAQMKNICDAAEDAKLPTDSVLLLFTNSTWLTKRPMFRKLREEMIKTFEPVDSFLVNSNQFFDTPNAWPLAFSIWKYKPSSRRDVEMSIPTFDLTRLSRSMVEDLPWDKTGLSTKDPEGLDEQCKSIFSEANRVFLGRNTLSIRVWSGGVRKDFQRERRKSEKENPDGVFGGFPAGDARHSRKKLCGEANGMFVGMMDNLSPCRISQDPGLAPWSRLDPAFASVNRARLLSTRPDKYAYDHSIDPEKSLTWYALCRTFFTAGFNYPLWANQEEIWCPWPRDQVAPSAFIQSVFALALCENECVETEFPANNPIQGVPRIHLFNPMSLDENSFWSQNLMKHPSWKAKKSASVETALGSVKNLYSSWSKRFKDRAKIHAEYKKDYFVSDDPMLSKNCGLLQIKHFAAEHQVDELLSKIEVLDHSVHSLKSEIYDWCMDKKKLDYFGKGAEQAGVGYKIWKASQDLELVTKKKSNSKSKPRKTKS